MKTNTDNLLVFSMLKSI